MGSLYDIYENDSAEKAYRLYIQLCFKVIHVFYKELSDDVQAMVNHAEVYWFRNLGGEISQVELTQLHDVLYEKIHSVSESNSLCHMPENKCVLLVLTPTVNFDYFDYYLDWVFELGSIVGVSNDRMRKWVNEIVCDYNDFK